MLRLRLRGPLGKMHTCSLNSTATLVDLQREAGTAFALDGEIDVLVGFPPTLCTADAHAPISDLLRSGDTAVVRKRCVDTALPQAPAASSLVSDASRPNEPQGITEMQATTSTHLPVVGGDPWACTVCTLENLPPATECAACGSERPLQTAQRQSRVTVAEGNWACPQCTLINSTTSAVCGACGASSGARPSRGEDSSSGMGAARVVKMHDDNSCLFHCMVYLLDPSSTPDALRRTIATEVRGNPQQWDEATLGKPREEYIDFISSPTRWGGQVELAIFASKYKVQIGVVEVQNGRCDIYGEGSGYNQRVYVLHSGIHFDAVTFGAQRRVYIAAFGNADAAAKRLASEQRAAGAFVDPEKMRLPCKICGFIAEGDLEARAHAGGMGHKEFAPA